MKKWSASAPSNIALIKYMGKNAGNAPLNSSLSYTLDHLVSTVEVEMYNGTRDRWEPLDGLLCLDDLEQAKFLRHFENIKKQFDCWESFIIRSLNGFPASCGLASSASSFAALTKVSVAALSDLMSKPALSIDQVAELSRGGSGSSCRSLFSPWALWDRTGCRAVEFPMGELHHQVVVLQEKRKEVASSDAHQRVLTSALFDGRPARAEARLQALTKQLRSGEWAQSFETVWAEFQDMHALFETSRPAFGYFEPETINVLASLRKFWKDEGDGPLVTMDAGPNVHLLFRRDQTEMAKEIRRRMERNHRVFGQDLK